MILVVPPLANSRMGVLAPHQLQACARRAGFDVRVHYSSLSFAACVGEPVYRALAAPFNLLLGEQVFSRAAFGTAPLQERFPGSLEGLDGEAVRAAEEAAGPWADREAASLAGEPLVTVFTNGEQTAAACALLRRLRALRPEATLALAGRNCEGEMANGLLSLDCGADYVFSGDVEDVFVRFLQGHRPEGRVLVGEPRREIESLPAPDYSEFFEQRRALGLPEGETVLPYETSRGCWWGQRHHCTFCGLNGLGMAYREKSPERVLEDLSAMVDRHPARRVLMSDWIMPRSYTSTLLPRLGEALPDLRVIYEVKSNLGLDDVLALKRGGATEVQPGIESLSTPLLKRMRKGNSARQNVALLRYGRSVGVRMIWNLLYAFPGDVAEDYEETLRLMPLLHHLQPPGGPLPVNLDRFSPYFDRPSEFGIRALRPIPAYRSAYPEGADLDRLALHFEGDFDSFSAGRPAVLRAIEAQAERWRSAWLAPEGPPALSVRPWKSSFVLKDTRGLPGTLPLEPISVEQARACLAGGRPAEAAWALERQVAVEVEGHHVPLATAPPDLLQRFEEA